jgi:hypothetical protein
MWKWRVKTRDAEWVRHVRIEIYSALTTDFFLNLFVRIMPTLKYCTL